MKLRECALMWRESNLPQLGKIAVQLGGFPPWVAKEDEWVCISKVAVPCENARATFFLVEVIKGISQYLARSGPECDIARIFCAWRELPLFARRILWVFFQFYRIPLLFSNPHFLYFASFCLSKGRCMQSLFGFIFNVGVLTRTWGQILKWLWLEEMGSGVR